MEYQLDTKAAKSADQINARIDTTGKYLGVFTRAEPTKSQKGSQGIDFSFKADNGATADYLTIWTHNASGETLHGYKLLMAIMTCMRVKALKPEVGEVEKYDAESKQRVKVAVPLFKDLMGKPVGLLLQMEQYAKKDGSTAWKPAIFAPFDTDEFTASEILNQSAKQETLAKMVAILKDRPLKASADTPAPAAGGLADFADDIPF